MATGYQGNFGPERQGDPLSSFLYRLVFGPMSRPGDGSARAMLQSFNPTNRAGLLNDLAMFAGGPKGDASPMMAELGMPGQFRDYGGADVHPLARGIPNEGPNLGARGAGIRGLVRRAQGVNPLRQADPVKVAEAKHAIIEKQVQAQLERHQAMQAVKMRRQVDAHLGSVPMAGHVAHPAPEHDYFDSQEFEHILDHPHADPHIQHGLDARQALVQHLMQRRYQAQLGHSHMN